MPKLYRDAATAHHETPDVAELRRLAEAANADAVRGATYERDWPLSSRAVGRFLRALNPDLAIELLDAAAERDALAAKVERVRALADEWTYNGEFGWDDGSHVYGPGCEGQALDYAAAKLRRVLDEEPQP